MNTLERVSSVSQALTQISLLDVYDAENAAMVAHNLVTHKKLAEEILMAKYQTVHSSWVFEKPEEVKERLVFIAKKFGHLKQLSIEKRKHLQEALAREDLKEKLRLEFANLSRGFALWARDTIENLESEHFGMNLQDVEAYRTELETTTTRIVGEAKGQVDACQQVDQKLKEMEVAANPYTTSSMETVRQELEGVLAALETRQKKYEAELQRLQEEDTLCKRFADVIEPFSKAIVLRKASMTAASGRSLQEQLRTAEECMASLEEDKFPFTYIRQLSTEIQDKGIASNRHTVLSEMDVKVQWDQYEQFLIRKKGQLEEDLEHQRTRGISKEVLKEIDETFQRFDEDRSGKIDKRELKQVLYSLGEEKTPGEIEQIIREFGNTDGGIEFDQFREFMLTIYGESDNKDAILQGFDRINRRPQDLHPASATFVHRMVICMNEADIEYIKSTAPSLDGGYDYRAWVEDVFSR